MIVMNDERINALIAAARQMRIDIINMTRACGNTGAHIGGSLSLVEIMAVLYLEIMRYDAKNPSWEDRDRLILSKGHGVMAQYAAMRQLGILTSEELLTFKQDKTRLFAHPSMCMDIGIEFSSGSLGQGLSLGVGTALALRRKGNIESHVFVVLGDGECDEGSVWEAAASASHYALSNLTVIVDRNRLQYDGPTCDILQMDDLAQKWSAFGFLSQTADGHSVAELARCMRQSSAAVGHGKPTAIIADTIKGKNVSFMENNPSWHNGALSKEQYRLAMLEQGVTI